jgi:hypothetical protein
MVVHSHRAVPFALAAGLRHSGPDANPAKVIAFRLAPLFVVID